MKKSFIILLSLISLTICGCINQGSDGEIIDDPTIDDEDAFEIKEKTDTTEMVFSYDPDQIDFVNENILVSGKQGHNEVDMRINFTLDDSVEIPVMYNKRFKKDEDADELWVKVEIDDENGKRILKDSKKATGGLDGKCWLDVHLLPENFMKLKEGRNKFVMSIETEMTTFFDNRTGIKPLKGEASFDFYVQPIYESKLYFKSLKLNKEGVSKKLGNNDAWDDTPEANIIVSLGGQTLLDKFSKNSYNVGRSSPVTFYHSSMKDQLHIQTKDRDYTIFNRSDAISDTFVSVEGLISTDYINLPLRYTDELLIYCKTSGQINSK